ncbi:MAG TPA: hypothetical protein VLH18_02280, partial [Candidatus Limnocylindrales bacterium]|nr:hypothetical protein [Candidatus Limnocylindrales bacterium]
RNATIYHTLRSVFLRVLPVGDRFMFYFAANASGQVSADVFTLQERYRERHITNDDFSVDHFYLLLEESQLRRVNWIVRNHGRAPGAHLSGPAHGPIFPDSVDEQERLERELPLVGSGYFLNSDFRPIGYYYTVMFWDDLTRNGRSEIFRWLLHVELWWILPFIVIPLLVVLGLRVITDRAGKRSDIHFAILFIVFSTGFSTMVLQIALLFSFQSVFGFVYEIVGLIVAIFMLGLALGALFTNRYLMARANINTLAGTQLLIVILSIIIAVLLPAAAAVQFPSIVFVLFSALTFTAGLINGIGFPLSTACYMKLNGHAEKSAGIVYSVELSGACIGAALASVVVVPILGIIASCIFAGVINGTAFATILISRRS